MERLPRFDLFPPGTEVTVTLASGAQSGVVVDVKEPATEELSRWQILGDSWWLRVPVRVADRDYLLWCMPEAIES